MPEKISDELENDIMTVIANFTPHEREKFAKARRMSVEELEQMIANWKATRQ